ncbi:hypothetical protein C3E77_12010 [Mycetocola zhujimingii]|nr:hypothetical protein C3E77_12010 [Mycetocola zhujimingii]
MKWGSEITTGETVGVDAGVASLNSAKDRVELLRERGGVSHLGMLARTVTALRALSTGRGGCRFASG